MTDQEKIDLAQIMPKIGMMRKLMKQKLYAPSIELLNEIWQIVAKMLGVDT